LLDARCAQASEPVTFDGALPAQKFFYRQRVAAAGIIKTDKSSPHGGYDFGLAPDDPALGVWPIT
jgi:hypothetical protein